MLRKVMRALLNIHPIRYKALTLEQSIDELIGCNKSLIRFGDGEAAICLGRGIYFQKFDDRLQAGLLRILREYTNDSPYLLALPNEYLVDYLFKIPLSRILMWADSRYVMRKYLRKDMVAGDAFLFRQYIVAENKVNIPITRLWQQFEHIICVGGNIDPTMVGTLFAGKELTCIPVAQENGFDDYDKVLSQILELFNGATALDKGNSLIVLSAGPVAKLLGYSLANSEYRVYDVGFLLNPQPILQKYNL